MKATFDISDPLYIAAKEFAQRNQTTMCALIEEGLRRVINDASRPARVVFKLADARVRGRRMLVTSPKAWQQLEEQHLTAEFSLSGKKDAQ